MSQDEAANGVGDLFWGGGGVPKVRWTCSESHTRWWLCGLCHLPTNFIGVTNCQDCSCIGGQQGRNEHIPWVDGSTESNEEKGEDDGHEGVHHNSSFGESGKMV